MYHCGPEVGEKNFNLYDFNILLKSLRDAGLGGEVMAINRKSTNS